MLGLMKKDLLMIKGNLKSVVIILVMLIIFTVSNDGNLSFLPAFISIVLFLSTFSYDEYNKWDSYAVTLPKGRKNVVISKYLSTLILLSLSIVLSVILSILLGYFYHNFNMNEILGLMAGSAFAVIILESFMYPVIFKYGVEKGRIGFFVFTFAIVGIITLLSKVLKPSPNITIFLEHYGIIICIIISIILLVSSYQLSVHIYRKKEF